MKKALIILLLIGIFLIAGCNQKDDVPSTVPEPVPGQRPELPEPEPQIKEISFDVKSYDCDSKELTIFNGGEVDIEDFLITIHKLDGTSTQTVFGEELPIGVEKTMALVTNVVASQMDIIPIINNADFADKSILYNSNCLVQEVKSSNEEGKLIPEEGQAFVVISGLKSYDVVPIFYEGGPITPDDFLFYFEESGLELIWPPDIHKSDDKETVYIINSNKKYVLTISKEEYENFIENLELGSQEIKKIDYNPISTNVGNLIISVTSLIDGLSNDGVLVELKVSGNTEFSGNTNSDGKHLFRDIPPNIYDVVISKEGYSNEVKNVEVTAGGGSAASGGMVLIDN